MEKSFKLNTLKNVLTNLSNFVYRLFSFFNRTIVGVICKDGVVLGAEKVLRSNLMVPTTDKRLYNIDSHVGMVISII